MFNTYDLFSMKGKNVLITGGRVMYGLGATMALADAGANLYLASHSVESAREFVEQLSAEKGVKVTAVPFDQGDRASIDAMFQTVIKDAGSLDAFIHCSRTIPTSTKNGPTPWDTGDDAIEANVRTNSAATIRMVQLAGEQMMKQHSGSIVVFGSMMGLIGVEKHNYDVPEKDTFGAPGAGGHTYAVDKSGLTAWIRHASSYYGQYGVRINAVCPGGLNSHRTSEDFARQYSKHTQLGRLANQEDVSGLILTLASDAGAYLTGLNIPIDGGYTAL